MALPAWLRTILVALALCVIALFVVEVFVQARAGATFPRMWNAWLAHIRDLKAVAYTLLGIIMTLVAQRVRLPF